MTGLPFGTASAYTDSFPSPPPKELTISSELCWNMSAFREVLRTYRKLDDQIIIRLNRASAQLRDRSRLAGPHNMAGGPDEMCVQVWREMMAGWIHRQTLLDFCVGTIESSIDSKRSQMTSPTDNRLEALPTRVDNMYRRRGVREEEALAEQLANEEFIEPILRKRSLSAFKSRCPYFAPPSAANNSERQWWDLAESGRNGKGPNA